MAKNEWIDLRLRDLEVQGGHMAVDAADAAIQEAYRALSQPGRGKKAKVTLEITLERHGDAVDQTCAVGCSLKTTMPEREKHVVIAHGTHDGALRIHIGQQMDIESMTAKAEEGKK